MTLNFHTMRKHAEALRDLLAPACTRIEIAGSIRREKPQVKDIELVAVAKPQRPVFGETAKRFDALDTLVREMESGGVLTRHSIQGTKYGERYRRLYLLKDDPAIAVDLFVVKPPAQWGAIYAIRTGPGSMNKRIMQHMLESQGIRQVDGHLEDQMGQVIDTPEEADWFAALGLPHLSPRNRSVAALQMAMRRAGQNQPLTPEQTTY